MLMQLIPRRPSLRSEWPEQKMTVPMIGDYNVTNALAALSVAKLYRISPQVSAKAFGNLNLTENRAEWLVVLRENEFE